MKVIAKHLVNAFIRRITSCYSSSRCELSALNFQELARMLLSKESVDYSQGSVIRHRNRDGWSQFSKERWSLEA